MTKKRNPGRPAAERPVKQFSISMTDDHRASLTKIRVANQLQDGGPIKNESQSICDLIHRNASSIGPDGKYAKGPPDSAPRGNGRHINVWLSQSDLDSLEIIQIVQHQPNEDRPTESDVIGRLIASESNEIATIGETAYRKQFNGEDDEDEDQDDDQDDDGDEPEPDRRPPTDLNSFINSKPQYDPQPQPQPETRRSPNGKIRASTEYAE